MFSLMREMWAVFLVDSGQLDVPVREGRARTGRVLSRNLRERPRSGRNRAKHGSCAAAIYSLAASRGSGGPNAALLPRARVWVAQRPSQAECLPCSRGCATLVRATPVDKVLMDKSPATAVAESLH